MRWWKSRSRGQKLAIALGGLVVVVAGGVLVAQGLALDEPVQPRESADREQPTVKLTGKPLALGTVARISANYRVAVTELDLYDFSPRRFMVVTVEARYVGKEDGEPWGDLTVKYVAPDSKIYSESACPFDLDELDASDQAVLKSGDVTTYGVCIELPAGSIEKGRVAVEEALARQEGTKSWTTDGATTKPLPSTFASPPSGVRPQTNVRAPKPNSRANDEWVEEYIEDVEEYKDEVAKLDKFAEENKHRFDQDDIDEYEDWKDDYDEDIAEYEKWKKEYEASR